MTRRREIRDAVRFGQEAYSVIANRYGFKDRSGPLRTAQYFERLFGIGKTDPSPEIPVAPQEKSPVPQM